MIIILATELAHFNVLRYLRTMTDLNTFLTHGVFWAHYLGAQTGTRISQNTLGRNASQKDFRSIF